MSVIGVITVFKCDGFGCDTCSTVHTDAEIESFATLWYSGIHLHFCPACRLDFSNGVAIQRDEAEMNEACRRLAARCRDISDGSIEQEFTNAISH